MPTRNIKTYSKKGKISNTANNLKLGLSNLNKKSDKKKVFKTNVYNTRLRNNFIDISLEPRTSEYATNLTPNESIRAPWAETTFDRLKRNSCDKIKSPSKKKGNKKLSKKGTKDKSYELSIQDVTGNTQDGEGIGDHRLIIENKKESYPANSFHLELTQCATCPEFAWNISNSQSSCQIDENVANTKETSKNRILSSTFTEKQHLHTDISYYFKNINTVASTPYKKSNNNLSVLSVSPIMMTSNSVFEKSVKKISSILEESPDDVYVASKKSKQECSSDLFSTNDSCHLVDDNENLNLGSKRQLRFKDDQTIDKPDIFVSANGNLVHQERIKEEEMKCLKSVKSDADSIKKNECCASYKKSEVYETRDNNLNRVTVDKQNVPIVLVEKLSDCEIMKYLSNVNVSCTSRSKRNSPKKKNKLCNEEKSVVKQKKHSKETFTMSTPKKVYDNRVPALVLTPIDISKHLNCNKNISNISRNISVEKSGNSEISNNSDKSSSSSFITDENEFNNNNSNNIQNQINKDENNLTWEVQILNDMHASCSYDKPSSNTNSLFELSASEGIVKVHSDSELMKQSIISISDDEGFSLDHKTLTVEGISGSVLNNISENNKNASYLNIKTITSSKDKSCILKRIEMKCENSLDEISKIVDIDNKSVINVDIHESQNEEDCILGLGNVNEAIKDTLESSFLQINNHSVSQEQNSSFECTQSKEESNKVLPLELKNTNISGRLFQNIDNKLNESRLNSDFHDNFHSKNSIILKPGKKWRRSLVILRSPKLKEQNRKGKKWLENIVEIMKMQPEYSKYKSTSVESLTQNNDKNFRRHSEFPHPRLSKRYSVRIVQEEKKSEKDVLKTSDLKSYASSINDVMDKKENADTSYESKASHCVTQFHDLYDITNSLNEIILSSSSPPPQKEDREFVSAKKIVLQRCEQDEPLRFEDIYSDSVLKKCHKIGEGVYGEVYLLKESNGAATVLKVIPIEGDIVVNGEPQKKFNEVLSEIIVSQELSCLRQGFYNQTSCFIEVKRIKCVQGPYPNRLTELWELYDEDRGSENDHPSIFPDDQLYIVFELAHGGQDLEGFKFLNAEQSYSVYLQAVFALAVAECELNFEHRDLHWGNLLVSYTSEREIVFNIKGEEFRVRSNGVKAVIIDFTLSRCTFDGCCIYNDLSEDQDLFTSDGDYQFEVYRLMQKKNGNEWGHFEPYSNVLWLHYVILKMIDGARYTREVSKKHKSHIVMMQTVEPSILTFTSAELLAKSGILKQL